MKSVTLTTFTLILFVMFFLPISAMGQDNPYYFTIKPGAYFPSDDLDDADFDSGFNGEVAVGYYFHPNFALEGGVGYFQTEASFRGSHPSIGSLREKDDIVVVPVTLTARGIIPFQAFEFYGGGGIGYYFANAESDITVGGSTDSDEDSNAVFGYHVIVGITVNITKNFFFGVEGKHFWTRDAEFDLTFFGVPVRVETNLNGYTVTGNLGFRF